ncbi:MAG: ribose-phosphate diphosphokinase [Candidatus Woesearchaeota archaeon]
MIPDSAKARLKEHFNNYNLDRDKIRLISGSAENQTYSEKIARLLNVDLTRCHWEKFKNDETYVRIDEGVRSRDVYLIQNLEPPLDTRIMEVLLFADAAKRGSAHKVSVIFPCLPYSRQDRISEAREPISSKVLSKLFSTCGIDKVITIDLHANQIVGFYDDRIYIDNLPSSTLFAQIMNQCLIQKDEKYVIVSPDAGGTKRVERFAKLLHHDDVDIASMQKKREKHNAVSSLKLVGNVKDRVAILYDDILDTGGTLLKAAKVLLDEGAVKVHIATTHALLNGDSVERLAEYQTEGIISDIFITDSVRPNKEKYELIKKSGLKLHIINLKILLADCIARIETQNHLSPLHSYNYIDSLYHNILPKCIK